MNYSRRRSPKDRAQALAQPWPSPWPSRFKGEENSKHCQAVNRPAERNDETYKCGDHTGGNTLPAFLMTTQIRCGTW